MGVLVLMVLILAMTGHSAATWCVCRTDVSDTASQKALDYACGAGADCAPILQNGACYQPNTVKAHCSYAVNSYYQRKNQGQGTCDFSASATVVTTDPSPGGSCVFPPNPSAAGTGTTPTPPTTPTSSTNTSTPPSTTTPTPSTFTPTIGGGIGLGPSGTGTDSSNGHVLKQTTKLSLLLTLCFHAWFFCWVKT